MQFLVCGKTTFVLQIADNIAKNNNKVIIFSLEQSRYELVSKAISRLTFEDSPVTAKRYNEIMKNKYIDNVTLEVIKQYSQEIAPNEIIEECDFSYNVETIKEYIKDYIATTNERPTIVIDYLQILAPSDTRLTDKQQVDYNITTLKKISRDYNIPIIVISSFNRGNYSVNAGFEASKESGAIEYTTDVLFTMQLKLLADENPHTKQEINDAKRKVPREVQLVCLKNRNGKSNFVIDFDFTLYFNHFREAPKDRQTGI